MLSLSKGEMEMKLKNNERQRLLAFLQWVDKDGAYTDKRCLTELGRVIPVEEALKLAYHEVLWRCADVYEEFNGDGFSFFELGLDEMEEIAKTKGSKEKIDTMIQEVVTETNLNELAYQKIADKVFA